MNRNDQKKICLCMSGTGSILMVLFIFIPTINVFRMSLYRMGGITNKQTFIGLENFKTLLGDKNFLQAMQNTILIIVLVMICTIILAVLFAALLNRGTLRERNFFRVIFYISEYFIHRCYCGYLWSDFITRVQVFSIHS